MNGTIDSSTGSMIYVDANLFIYAMEGDDALAELANEFFLAMRRTPRTAVTSELTLAEVLPKAMDEDVRKRYMDLIVWSDIFDVRPITREIILQTATHRRLTATTVAGQTTMQNLPDAIHVVTALWSGCHSFVSSDKRLRMPPKLRTVSADAQGIRPCCAA